MTDFGFDNDTFNMTLEVFLMKARGPKHLALSTVVPLTLIYGMIFVTGVVGNISVCAVIVKNPSMHTATNYYLFSLAVSDLTLLILGLPNELSLYYQQYPWALGVALCKFRALVSEMVSYTSVLTIVAFSMERYLAICHPLHHYAMSGLERAVKIIAMLWVVSLVSAAPFAVYTRINYLDYPPGSGNLTEESGICAMLAENVPPNWPIYEISSILFFLLPMVVILILYARMGIKIRKRTGSSLGKKLEGSVHETKHSSSSSKKAIVRMLAAVVIAFFLCWAPFHAQRVMYLYFYNCPSYPIINEWLYYIAGCLYYFSSTVNPILYNVMSAKYRLAFKETLCGFMPQDRSRIQRSWNGDSFSRTRSTRSTNHSVRQIRRNDRGVVVENFKFGDKIELETDSICENTNLISKYKLENQNLESEGGGGVVKNSIVVINPTAKKYSTLSRPSRWSKAFLRVVRSKTSDSNNKFSNNIDHNSPDDTKEKCNSHSSKVCESGKTEVLGNSIRTFANMEGESSI